MPTLLYQVITVVFDLVVVIFAAVYLYGVRRKEKEIDKRENKIDSDYQQVLNDGMARERQMLQNAVNQSNQIMQVATHQANQILSGTQYLSQAAKQTLESALQKMITDVHNTSTNSKINLEQALQKIVIDVHKEASTTGTDLTQSYQSHLKQMATISLNGFQNVTNNLELELSQQIKEFRTILLTNIEKDVEIYKQSKIRRIDQASNQIVQKVAQEVLNKSLSIEDHENLVVQSLEKAKKEGVFD